METIKIAFCDDEEMALSAISSLLKSAFQAKNIPIEMSLFLKSNDLANALLMNDYNLFVMDIDLKSEANGIDFLEDIRKKGFNAPVIFISNREDLVFEAIKHKPLCFIRKKSILEDLETYFDEIIKAISNGSGNIFSFEDRGSVYNINLDEVIYIESSSKDQFIYFENDKCINVKQKMKYFDEELKDFGFYRCHGSYLVNLRKIKIIRNHEVILKNDCKIPVSRSNKENLKLLFLNDMQKTNIIK